MQRGTKKMAQNEKEKILMYGLTDEEESKVQNRHGKDYEIVKTDCFTDIIAIPAEMVIVNPEKLSETELKQMNEVFQHDCFTLILFTTSAFNKNIMPNLKYWANFEDYMNGAKIGGNTFKYVKKLCDDRLATYFPAGVPDYVTERYQQELEYIKACDGEDELRLFYELSIIAKEHNSFIGTRWRGHNLFIRFLLGNSTIDPLAAYRYCPHCGYAEQLRDVTFGIDAAAKNCPACGERLLSRGYALHPVFVWGSDPVKNPFGTLIEDYKCSTRLNPFLVQRINELYTDCQVVSWLSSRQNGEEMEKIGVCVLPKGKDLQNDFPQFVIQDKSGETGMDGWSLGALENGILAIALVPDQLLDAIEEAKGGIAPNCIKQAEDRIKKITAEELIKTCLLNEEEITALQNMPTTTRFQLTEALAVARNTFGELESTPWKETPYSLDTEKSFYTRETLYERLLKLGLSDIDAYNVTSCVRKGKAYSKAFREKWLQMVKRLALPEDLVCFCQNYKYMCSRGDVLEQLWLLSVLSNE
jgi:hypothetical protein